jgi:glc operon protein GlcG
MPFQKPVLSLEEARRAMDRMLQEVHQKFQNRPVAIAIVDDQGELVSFARQDRCAPQPPIVARKKAYTAARTRTDTKAYADRLKSQGRSVTEFGDPNLLAAQGGVVITNPADQSVLGAIGVSGLTAEEDEALARIGLSALGQR